MQLTHQAKEVQQRLASQPNWQETYRVLLLEARQAPVLEQSLRTDENRVHGCEAKVWLRHRVDTSVNPPAIYFEFVSDARMIQALIHIALLPLQGQSAETVASFDTNTWLQSCGLQKQLSPSRSNGLTQVIAAARQAVSSAL